MQLGILAHCLPCNIHLPNQPVFSSVHPASPLFKSYPSLATMHLMNWAATHNALCPLIKGVNQKQSCQSPFFKTLILLFFYSLWIVSFLCLGSYCQVIAAFIDNFEEWRVPKGKILVITGMCPYSFLGSNVKKKLPLPFFWVIFSIYQSSICWFHIQILTRSNPSFLNPVYVNMNPTWSFW